MGKVTRRKLLVGAVAAAAVAVVPKVSAIAAPALPASHPIMWDPVLGIITEREWRLIRIYRDLSPDRQAAFETLVDLVARRNRGED